MPKILIATTAADVPTRLVATTSIAKVKARIHEYKLTEWTVGVYDVKFTAENVCKLLENFKDFAPLETYQLRINSSQQCREI